MVDNNLIEVALQEICKDHPLAHKVLSEFFEDRKYFESSFRKVGGLDIMTTSFVKTQPNPNISISCVGILSYFKDLTDPPSALKGSLTLGDKTVVITNAFLGKVRDNEVKFEIEALELK